MKYLIMSSKLEPNNDSGHTQFSPWLMILLLHFVSSAPILNKCVTSRPAVPNHGISTEKHAVQCINEIFHILVSQIDLGHIDSNRPHPCSIWPNGPSCFDLKALFNKINDLIDWTCTTSDQCWKERVPNYKDITHIFQNPSSEENNSKTVMANTRTPSQGVDPVIYKLNAQAMFLAHVSSTYCSVQCGNQIKRQNSDFSSFIQLLHSLKFENRSPIIFGTFFPPIHDGETCYILQSGQDIKGESLSMPSSPNMDHFTNYYTKLNVKFATGHGYMHIGQSRVELTPALLKLHNDQLETTESKSSSISSLTSIQPTEEKDEVFDNSKEETKGGGESPFPNRNISSIFVFNPPVRDFEQNAHQTITYFSHPSKHSIDLSHNTTSLF